MKNEHLCGRWSIVSKTWQNGGETLVGFCGDVYPHDLNEENIAYIKAFCGYAPNAVHEIHARFPEHITPAYPAAKTNFINGFMLIKGG